MTIETTWNILNGLRPSSIISLYIGFIGTSMLLIPFKIFKLEIWEEALPSARSC
jgi:hypothetical protein